MRVKIERRGNNIRLSRSVNKGGEKRGTSYIGSVNVRTLIERVPEDLLARLTEAERQQLQDYTETQRSAYLRDCIANADRLEVLRHQQAVFEQAAILGVKVPKASVERWARLVKDLERSAKAYFGDAWGKS